MLAFYMEAPMSDFCQSIRLLFALASLVLVLGFTSLSAGAQLVIDGGDLRDDAVHSREALYGYRHLSKDFFDASHEAGNIVAIPADVFVMSAKNTTLVLNKLKMTGKPVESADIDDWYTASKLVGVGELSTVQPSTMTFKFAARKQVQADPALVAGLADTELFKSMKPKKHVAFSQGVPIDYLAANKAEYRLFKTSYGALDGAWQLPAGQAKTKFAQASGVLASMPYLNEVSRFLAGQVTFGKPVVYTAAEKKLVLPSSLTASGEVYWIELAVSFREVEIAKFERFTFSVTAQAGIIAVELIPLRFEKGVETKRTVASPDIKIKYGEGAVEIGRVFEQQIVYTSLKPTIVAGGLQESDFSWSMMDDAMQPGARRFVAVIQVPKGRRSVSLQLQGSGTLKWKLFAQGGIVATNVKLIEVPLK